MPQLRNPLQNAPMSYIYKNTPFRLQMLTSTLMKASMSTFSQVNHLFNDVLITGLTDKRKSKKEDICSSVAEGAQSVVIFLT